MSEVIVLAGITVRPGTESEAEELLVALLAPTHAEEGCLLYAIHRATVDARKFAIVERWASRELMTVHGESAHMKAAVERLRGLLESPPEVTVYEPVPGGEAAKGMLA